MRWSRNNDERLDAKPRSEAEKIRRLVRCGGGQHGLCTVGHTGNDLHYRGYDVADLAAHATYEEVAYLLIHGELPTPSS